MKVLLNAMQVGNRSGTGRYTLELARWVPAAASGLEVGVLWPEDEPLPVGAKTEVFQTRSIHSGVGRIWYDQFRARGECKRLEADAMHYTANHGNYFGAVPSIVTVHDLSFFRSPEWFRFNRALYYRASVARSCRTASRIISVSQCTADDLVGYLGVEASRIDVVHSGVDAAFCPCDERACEEVRAKYGLPSSFFLYVGTLEPRKNLARVVEAWTEIAGKCSLDLVIAGREGWKNRTLHTAKERSPYGDRIHFPGFIEADDLPALLSAAEVFVWPSLWEGFGLPPLEALACGTPVLTSNVSSIPEIVGDAALLVDPCNVRDISQAMFRLASEKALRDELKAKGLARAAEFTWARTARLTVECYQKVVGG